MRLDHIISNLFGIAAVILLLFIMLSLSSCRTQRVAGANSDSVRVEYHLDSIYLYERDSIYIDRYRSNDTVYITNDRWHTRYKDKIVEVHDTTTVTATETVIQTERYIPGFYKWSTWVCWIIIACFIIYVAWRLLKVYLKAQSGGIL